MGLEVSIESTIQYNTRWRGRILGFYSSGMMSQRTERNAHASAHGNTPCLLIPFEFTIITLAIQTSKAQDPKN